MTDDEEDRARLLKNLDAERAVLGACMMDPDAIATVIRVLSPDDFYRAPHQTLYATLTAEWELGNPTDPIAIAAALEQRGELLRVGGGPYLHDVYASTPSAVSVGYWAELVAGAAARARIADVGMRIRQLATDDESRDISELQGRVRDVVEAATESRGSTDVDEGVWVGEAIDDHAATWDLPQDQGIASPWMDMNEVIGGLQPEQMLVLGGRPGSGKSTAAKDWAVSAALHDFSVMFVSLEMSRGELIDRMVSADSRVRLSDIRRRTMSHEDKYKAHRSIDNLRKLPLKIEDRFVSTMAGVRAKAREQARGDYGLDLLVVDHISLLQSTSTKRSRNEEVSEFSRSLKLLAKELQIAVIAVSQLNRGPEQRPDKMPVISDLRESGSLEQDSDLVILVYRPDYYERESPRSGEADLILAKHRNGPTATVTVAHQLHYARFTDLARG